MKIPISSLYYMLCYAWGETPQASPERIGTEDFSSTTNLFARLLIISLENQDRQGFIKRYRSEEEEIPGIRGKLQLSRTIKENSLAKARTYCVIDLFDLNNLPNQILKYCTDTLLKSDDLDQKYVADLDHYMKVFSSVDLRSPQPADFRRLRFGRSEKSYYFLMNLCELIASSFLPHHANSSSGAIQSLLQDEVKMRAIFQQFIRNFYARENTVYKVSSPHIQWRQLDGTDLDKLPIMMTDVVLNDDQRHIIIETKYVPEVLLNNRFENKKLSSNHLYQLNSYLHNYSRSESKPEGILMYPANGYDMSLKYSIDGYSLKIQTINLSQPWSQIHSDLLKIVA